MKCTIYDRRALDKYCVLHKQVSRNVVQEFEDAPALQIFHGRNI